MDVMEPKVMAPATLWTRLGASGRAALRSPVLRNIATVACGTAGAQVITLALMPVITRLYGPEAYGVLGVFMSLAFMLIPIAALTYPVAIVLPKHDGDARGLIRLSLLIASGFALLAAVFIALFGETLASQAGVPQIGPFLMLLPLVLLAGAALEVTQQWLIRKQRYRLTAGVAVQQAIAHNGLRIAVGLLHASPATLLLSTIVGPLLHTLMLNWGLRRSASAQAQEPAIEPQPLSTRELALQYNDFPLYRAPQMLINAVSQNLPTLVLAVFFGPVAAGFFALCRQALNVPTQLIGKSVADVYYPRISAAVHNHEPITAMLAKATAALALVGLLPFALVFCFGPQLFALVFGEQWAVAGEYARWLALAEYMIFVSRPCTVAVPALALQGRFLVFEVLSTVLRIAALMAGALFLEQAEQTVMAFTTASILIYLSLIASVLLAARNWHGKADRQTRRDRP
ncbi:polysaccharide biosynthesis protein [Pseudomonas daroniae]|uniref:Polysaccharide biosynthesis protein n=2 Tax=Pseudomonadales TaxID=72274 RepID=A0A4Q9QIB4_9GAMM|nr:polysaccharide biosynthesis protein [Pseudomonas daroniae]TBU80541.1 polysaccharide biosynthesis protein [Pseudomonas sp. FRB 228]TBU89634.1 polysaccharide biosynthesis protein [Pseudomonas daroniae]